MIRKIVISLCLILILSGCGPEMAQVPPDTNTAKIISSQTPYPSPTNTPAPLPESNYPMALEVISPENVDRLEQIDRWGEGNIHSVAVSPDEKTIAVYTVSGIHLYDSMTLEETQFIDLGIKNDNFYLEPLPIAFSPDGKYLAFGDGQFTIIWDFRLNQYDHLIYSPIPDWYVAGIEFSPDGKRILITTKGLGYFPCDSNGENYALYTFSGALLFDRYACWAYSYNKYRFTSDGKLYIFFNSIMTLQHPLSLFVVDVNTGSLLKSGYFEPAQDYTSQEPNDSFYDVSPDGKYIASIKYEDKKILSEITSVETWQVVKTVEGMITFINSNSGNPSWVEGYIYQHRIKSVNEKCGIINDSIYDAYSEVLTTDSKLILTVGDLDSGSIQHIELWDYPSCEVEKVLTYPSATQITFSPGGNLLASSGSGDINVWDIQSKEIEFHVRNVEFTYSPRSITFNSDGSRLISSVEITPFTTYQILVWDTESGKLLRALEPSVNSSHHIYPSFEPNIIAVGDWNANKLLFWDIESGELLFTSPYGVPTYDKQGNAWITLGENNRLKKLVYYDIQSGLALKIINTPYRRFRDLHLNENGSNLVGLTFNRNERQEYIVIYDTESGNQIKEILVDRTSPNSMEAIKEIFTIYGSHGFIDLWRIGEDEPFLEIKGDLNIRAVNDNYDGYRYFYFHDLMFSIDGKMIVTQNSYNLIRFWDTQTGQLLGEITPDYKIEDIVFSPDGRIIAVSGEDGLIRIWGVPEE